MPICTSIIQISISHVVWLTLVHEQVTSNANCNQGRKETKLQRSVFMKHEEQERTIHKNTDSAYFLNRSTFNVTFGSEWERLVFFVLLDIFVCSHFFSTRDSFLCCDLGKRLRRPGHSRSRGGGLGRECRCSCVQRRPCYETSRQGRPGREALHPYCSLFMCVPYKQMCRIISHVSV